MEVNNKKIEKIELVEKLQLLLVSKQTWNIEHINEIEFILKKLREAEIILQKDIFCIKYNQHQGIAIHINYTYPFFSTFVGISNERNIIKYGKSRNEQDIINYEKKAQNIFILTWEKNFIIKP